MSKVFEDDGVETRALKDIRLTICQGEYVAIEGPSGCGKTTLLNVIGLLDAPTSGEYLLDGRPTSALAPSKRATLRNYSLGFIFQSFNLIGELDVYRNVELPLTYRRMTALERRSRVREALARVNMSDFAHKSPAKLSGGQQQRVAVARAIVGRPTVILADEPTGNLDSESGEAVMQLLSELNADGATICLVTHDQRYARRAQRAIHLLDGQEVPDAAATP